MRNLMGLALALALAAPAFAQEGGGAPMMHEMDGMVMMMPPAGASAATQGYVAAMNGMSEAMMAPYTGDPDVDFIRGMIPHHQGAVDAAKVELQYGNDPDARAFAERVIAAQEAEIAWMKDWLKAKGY